jgi:hypothetical protein
MKAQQIRELYYARLRANYVVEIVRAQNQDPAIQ